MSDKKDKTTTYKLTVIYDKQTDNIESLIEEFTENAPCIFYGDLVLDDYWDEESIDLINQMYEVGVS